MKTQNTKPIHLSSIYTKLFTAMLMFFAAAAVTLGVSARPVYAVAESLMEFNVGQTITFDTSDFSNVKSSNPKVVKVVKKGGKYIATAMKTGTYQEDKDWFSDKGAKLYLYKNGKHVITVWAWVKNKGKLIYTGESVSYKTSAYSKVTSDDPKILKVTKKKGKYVVTAKKEGNTVLKLYKNGKLSKAIGVLTVKKSSFKVNTSTITLKKGDVLNTGTLLKKLKVKGKSGKYYWDVWSSDFSVLSMEDVDFAFHVNKTGKVKLMLTLYESSHRCIVKTYKVMAEVK